jgi:hypothetical protein
MQSLKMMIEHRVGKGDIDHPDTSFSGDFLYISRYYLVKKGENEEIRLFSFY